MPSALEGLRVVELTLGMAGPMAGMMLADNGAEVIRVEQPGAQETSYAPGDLVWNRGKKSVVLDLKAKDDRRAFLRLVQTADVLLESFRPGVTQRLGIDYDSLRRDNPALVYTTITGYGSTGPLADRPGYESLVQARLGLQAEQPLHAARPAVERDGPIMIGLPLANIGAFFMALYGTLAALYVRSSTGQGQHVETSLFQGLLANLTMRWWRSERYKPVSPNSMVDGKLMPWLPTIFQSKDGVWFYSMGSRRFPKEYAEALGVPGAKPGIPITLPETQQHALYEEMAAAFKRRTWRELEELFERLDCIALRVQRAEDTFDDEQVRHNGLIVEVADPRFGQLRQVGVPFAMAETPPKVQGPAPTVGQHTDQVLSALDALPSKRFDATRRTDGPAPKHPLEGVVVLDMGDFLAGPVGPQLLADLGATVIKLERPSGDPVRVSTSFMACNRGKRAIAVDLRTEEGREVCHKLARRADIVHQNWRPGVAERLDVDYETIRGLNPNVVYCHNVPFGFDGPKAHRGGLDQIMQAYGGTLDRLAGEGNAPTTWLKTGVCDFAQAMMGGVAMLLALVHRAKTGQGQFVGSRMIDVALFLHSDVVLGGRETPQRPTLDAEAKGFGALYRLYEAKDGWLCLAAVKDAHWRGLCEAIKRPDLPAAARFANRWSRLAHERELAALLEAAFLMRTTDEWRATLDAVNVPCEASRLHWGHEGERFGDDQDAVAKGWVVHYEHPVAGRLWQTGLPFNLSKTPGRIWGPPPSVGEHTREIMAWLGYADGEIDALKESGVLNWEPRLGPRQVAASP